MYRSLLPIVCFAAMICLLATSAPAQPGDGIPAEASHELEAVTSQLSPAVLFRSKQDNLVLLRDMETFGLGGPQYVAYPTADGVAVKKVEGELELPAPSESWLLVWFSGGRGWDNFTFTQYVARMFPETTQRKLPAIDMPVLLSLQRKPAAITVSDKGVKLVYDGPTGWVAWMPAWGVKVLDPQATKSWAKDLPEDVVKHCRTWNGYLKAVPYNETETYTVDIASDAVTVSQTYDWLEIKDEWNTTPVYAAPQPPMMALAKTQDDFPVTFETPAVDSGVATRFGPLWVCEGEQAATYTINGMLKYINTWQHYTGEFKRDAELAGKAEDNLRAIMPQKIEALRKGVAELSSKPSRGPATGGSGLLQAGPWIEKQQVETIANLTRQAITKGVYNPRTYKNFDEQNTLKSGREFIGTHQGYAGDVEPLSFFAIQAVGAYGIYTGDWSVLQDEDGYEKYLKKIAAMKFRGNGWLIQGRANSGGDSFHNMVQGLCAMGRVAAKADDPAEYGENAYIFAKTMTYYDCYANAALEYARQFRAWATPLMPQRDGQDPDTVVWDYYVHHGPNFSYVGQQGFYGAWTGYYEHIARSNMPGTFLDRFWADHLQDRAKVLFDRNDMKQFDTFKLGLVNMFLGKVLDKPVGEMHLQNSVKAKPDRARLDSLIQVLETAGASTLEPLFDGGQAPDAFTTLLSKAQPGVDQHVDSSTFQFFDLFKSCQDPLYKYPFPFAFGWNNPQPIQQAHQIVRKGAAIRRAASGHVKHCFGLGFVWPDGVKPSVMSDSKRLGWVGTFHYVDAK